MGTLTFELAAGLAAITNLEVVLYTTAATTEHLRTTQPWSRHVQLVTLPGDPSDARPQRLASELTLLPARLRRDGVDVLHSVANLGPPVVGVPHVITIHDLLYRHFPSTHPGVSRYLVDGLTRLCVRTADAIVVPSRFTMLDLEHALRVPREKMHVIPLGRGMPATTTGVGDRARRRFGLGDRRVVLSLGVGFEHKNVGRLVEAFARVGPLRDAVLVNVGSPIFEGQSWARRAAELGLGDRVVWPSHDNESVDDAALEDLFAAAELLVHPSLLEGFGLPPLEAMNRGVPVVCSRAGSLPEVAGDAAEYFDPLDVGDMANAMARVLDDPERARAMIALGRMRAREFSWEDNARAHAHLYRDLVTKPCGS